MHVQLEVWGHVCACVWNRREQIWSYIPAHCAEH